MAFRALVLGGGGPVGIAWESGLIAGLEAEGVRLADAERIVGTSAGSVVGAQLALGASGADLANGQRQQFTRAPVKDVNRGTSATSDAPAASAPPADPRPPRNEAPDLGALMKLFAARPVDGGEAAQLGWRREVGQYALAARTIEPDAFIASFGRMASTTWPARDYRCTAIDALTGAFKVWTAEDHVQLGAAIASSCAVPGIYPCIPIAGVRWYDGGLRSATNADLAAGADVVVVVSVMPPAALGPVGSTNPLDAEIAALRAGGSKVELIVADEPSRAAFGPNLMDARKREGALEAGIVQGKALAAQLRALW